MAFNPQDINKSLKVNAPQDVDAWKGKILADGRQVPYASVAEACASIPKDYRTLCKTVWITTDTGNSVYWWKDGIEDADLVLFEASRLPIKSAPGDATLSIPANTLIDLIVIEDSNNPVISAGFEPNGNEILDGFPLQDGFGATVFIISPSLSVRTIYLTGYTPNTIIKLFVR
jgi:hypothetical protein